MMRSAQNKESRAYAICRRRHDIWHKVEVARVNIHLSASVTFGPFNRKSELAD